MRIITVVSLTITFSSDIYTLNIEVFQTLQQLVNNKENILLQQFTNFGV